MIEEELCEYQEEIVIDTGKEFYLLIPEECKMPKKPKYHYRKNTTYTHFLDSDIPSIGGKMINMSSLSVWKLISIDETKLEKWQFMGKVKKSKWKNKLKEIYERN